jgi:ribosomal protein S18 acetylase RimI-like enzyme
MIPKRADPADAKIVARLLHDFNTEFGEPTPGPEALAERIRELLSASQILVLLAGDPPEGLALLRFRPSLWSETLDCYLEELYVVPQRRGQGIGRALLEAAMEAARQEGAAHIDLGTSEDDTAARALYERLGFTNREGKPDGPVMFVYEREL